MDYDKVKAQEKSAFQSQVASAATGSATQCTVIIVGPNDTMSQKVRHLLQCFSQGPVFVASRGSGIAKMIAVVEIAKQELRAAGVVYTQFNRSDKQASRIDPHARPLCGDNEESDTKPARKQSTRQVSAKTQAKRDMAEQDRKEKEAAAAETAQRQQALRAAKDAVHGEKTYTLPILYILLAPGQVSQATMTATGWTVQT